MLGSLHEADDAVQDAYLKAWRAYDFFDDGGSFKGWLYRIATNACLDAIAKRKHIGRILPDQHAPASTEFPDGQPANDVSWLEPLPDGEIDAIPDETLGPEALYTQDESVRLAFVAVLQSLPPRQRAAVLLTDVLGWSAQETAAQLGDSVASVNSALQRGRKTLAFSHGLQGLQNKADLLGADEAKLLERYLSAWQKKDVDQLASILKHDAVYTMPPLAQWYLGPDQISRFFIWAWAQYDGFLLHRIAANRQPAFAAYCRQAADRGWTAHSLHILSIDADGITRITLFYGSDAPRLFASFGLEAVIPD